MVGGAKMRVTKISTSSYLHPEIGSVLTITVGLQEHPALSVSVAGCNTDEQGSKLLATSLRDLAAELDAA